MFAESLSRRRILKSLAVVGAGACPSLSGCSARRPASERTNAADRPRRRLIQTVRGAIDAGELGPTLVHEHVMCDFIGAAKTGRHRYDAGEVVEVMRPYLEALRPLGVTGFVDCTPMFIGRDVEVLARLAELTGLHIVTNTGLYKEPFLPEYALSSSPDELAGRWVGEFENGIDGTGIRPGFIKIAVNPGPLIPVQQRIVRAACRTSRATGMTIACHTGHGVAAGEALNILTEEGVPPDNFIFVHADSEKDPAHHLAIARRGAWVEFDAIRRDSQEKSLERVRRMLQHGLIDRLLISQDSGWYSVGEPRGGGPAGKIRGYTYLFEKFVPLLRESGVAESDVRILTVLNPAKAFAMDHAPVRHSF